MMLQVSFLPAAIHWDFALHRSGLPAAHHSPVLPGVHPGEPWGALGMTRGRGALPTVLRVVTDRCACQPGSYGQAIHGCRPCDCSRLSGQCVLGPGVGRGSTQRGHHPLLWDTQMGTGRAGSMVSGSWWWPPLCAWHEGGHLEGGKQHLGGLG